MPPVDIGGDLPGVVRCYGYVGNIVAQMIQILELPREAVDRQTFFWVMQRMTFITGPVDSAWRSAANPRPKCPG
jgi:hypothetical protein